MQAILDLSAPHRTSPASPSPHLPDSHPMVNVNHLRGVSPTHPHVKTEHLPDGLNTVRWMERYIKIKYKKRLHFA